MSKVGVRLFTVLAAALLTAGAAIAAPKSIFDDDWVPPTRPADVPPVRPADPAAAPNPVPPVAPLPKMQRHAIPAKPDLDASRRQFIQLFAADLADKTARARAALAAKLIEDGHKCADKPADQCALYAGARQAAIEARDLRLCFAAADALSNAFDVDAVAIKGEAAAAVGVKAETPVATASNLEAAATLLEALVAAEDYAAASKLAASMQKAAAEDPFYRHVLPRRAKEIDAAKLSFERVRKDREKLKAAPDDPAACGSVGAYECFVRGDWAKGVPLLAKGTVPELKKLAATEAAGATDAESSRKLADGWAAAAAHQPEGTRGAIIEHALALYRRAMAGTTGMQKLAIDNAVQKAVKSLGPRRVDLLALIDPAADALGGKWWLEDGTLRSDGRASRLEMPYSPGDEYVLKVEFLATGDVSVRPALWKAGKTFLYVLGNFNNTYAGIENVDGTAVGNNRTRVDLALDRTQRHVLVIEVYNNRIRATVDGRVVHDYATTFKEITTPPTPQFTAKDPSRLALCVWNTPSTFYQVQVVEVTGTGRQGR